MINWIKQIFCYIINFINHILRRNQMILPTTQNGKYVDINRVGNVVKFTKNGITYFFATVDNEPVWLIYSPELEKWFLESGVFILNISGEPEIICNTEKVTNIPEKYFDKNISNGNKPKIK